MERDQLAEAEQQRELDAQIKAALEHGDCATSIALKQKYYQQKGNSK